MKILVLIREYPPYACGGMGRVVCYLEDFCRRNNWPLTIIANQPGWRVTREDKGAIVIYRVPTLGATFLTKLPTYCFFASLLVNRLAREHDLIYSVSSPFFAKTKIPLVAHFQGTRFGEYLACKKLKKPLHALLNKLYVFFDRLILEKAGGVIVLSPAMLSEINNSGRFDKKAEIVPNGVDTKLFCPAGPRSFDQEEKTVLYAGRLDLRKGVDTLLSAFRQMRPGIKARLVIAGGGSQEKRLRGLARSLGIAADFLGKVDLQKLPALYNKADLLVMPSLYEPFGLVVLEAMACATPVIVSNVCPDFGVPRFAAGNSADLAKAMSEVLGSPARQREISEAGYQSSRDYSWDKVIEKLIGYLKQFA